MGKRGPKSKAVKRREPNGRASRNAGDVAERLQDIHDREERDTLSVGLEARMRLHGIAEPKEARDQKAGSFVGRLHLTRQISTAQYEAAMNWLTSCEEYAWAVCSPRQPGAIDLNHVRGKPTARENVARARRVVERHKGAISAVQAAQNELRLHGTLFAALQYLVETDLELQHMVPDLRVALNALARFYKTEAKEAA